MKTEERSGLRLRPAGEADSNLLLEWRNDPLTRAQSVNTAEVAHEEHAAWLKKTLADPSIALYIVEEDGAPVGTVRVDRRGRSSELSWTVAPGARGRGIGTAMVRLACSMVEGPVEARIKSGNAASARIATNAGFALEREEGGVGVWRLHGRS